MKNNEERSFLSILDNAADILLNLLAAAAAYIITPLWTGYNFLSLTPLLLLYVCAALIFLSFVYQFSNLYRPSRYVHIYDAFSSLFRSNVFCFALFAIVILLAAEVGQREFLLKWDLITFAVSTLFLTFKREITIGVLTFFRRRHLHLRKIIIVGDNTESAKEYIRQLQQNPQYGFMVLGFVGDRIRYDIGVDKLGSFENLGEILDRYQPSDVIFAIDSYNKKRLIRLVNQCDDRCIKVYFLPVIYGYFKTPRQIEQVGAMPLINIHATPLDNRANAALKRLTDIVGSLALILLTSPIMLAAAIGVRISSPGPILFRQTRVGRMGKKFTMLKFRSMRVNKESDKAWTTGTDPRKTKFGAFLRATAIDELPQLFNVLRGDMSLVGPRPEIPHFVESFKTQIPLYMIKHYVKPGMTGLAQVRGLRGDTSLTERIKADIFYIENWSYGMDILILLKTPFKAFNKSEQYSIPVDDKVEAARKAPTIEDDSDPIGTVASVPSELTARQDAAPEAPTVPDREHPVGKEDSLPPRD